MGWVYNASPEVEAQCKYRVILGVCISLTVLMVLTVCLRLFVRVKLGRFGAADYVMVFGMIFSIIYNGLCIAQSRYGLGLPLATRPKENLPIYTKVYHSIVVALLTAFDLDQLNYAGRPIYQLGIAGFKAALCISYLHLLSKTSKRFYRKLIWVVIVVSTLGHIAGALVLILNCQPVRRSWDPTTPGTCLPVGPTFYGLAIFTIVCDVVIIFLPIPLLLQLNIKPAQKAGVVCLFLLGLFTTICSILRLTQIHRVVAVDGDSTMLVLWGTIEFNIGNIVTSLPFLTPLLKVFIRDFRSRSGSEYRKNIYTLQSFSKGQRSQAKSEYSKEPMVVKRTPSEELILDSDDLGQRRDAEIHITVEYRVSLEQK
ncbi:uncharacterized protein ACLA_099080 [Aspergillus clavatus NRRL 1]|uniref:Integral membrane protein n=1 Tax=Aspergillus clavatus (strain ATCC 1007 / CBS 513.65 / DSM 816 / NCTC 3887 / NRRL 1 / QM 1276 / 107) TaxID=344612 RepID=A1CN27_ASPCL|nr:uncharacterized protein ACLA_099080 [Aspergillus clavatus NRRL 1]EAW08964.1 integral membrane protein [Aspergillus clavatus NRRL 1]